MYKFEVHTFELLRFFFLALPNACNKSVPQNAFVFSVSFTAISIGARNKETDLNYCNEILYIVRRQLKREQRGKQSNPIDTQLLYIAIHNWFRIANRPSGWVLAIARSQHRLMFFCFVSFSRFNFTPTHNGPARRRSMTMNICMLLCQTTVFARCTCILCLWTQTLSCSQIPGNEWKTQQKCRQYKICFQSMQFFEKTF